MNLEKKIGRGLAFLLLSTAGSRLVALGANVALARLLLPGDWGMMAFALLVVNTLGLLRSMGVGEALIHRRRADQEGNDAGFFLVACLGLALYGAIYAGAPRIALWAEEEVRWLVVRVLRLIGLLVIFQSLAAVPIALLERQLEFEQKLYTDTLPALVYAALAVLLAWWGWGIWSLVWGRLAAVLVSCAAAWFFRPGIREPA